MKVSLWSVLILVASAVLACISINRYVQAKNDAEYIISYDLNNYKDNMKKEIIEMEDEYFYNSIVKNTNYTRYSIDKILFVSSSTVEVVVTYSSSSPYRSDKYRTEYYILAPNKAEQYYPYCINSGYMEHLLTGQNYNRMFKSHHK